MAAASSAAFERQVFRFWLLFLYCYFIFLEFLQVLKSGPLSIFSEDQLGWRSWKKRWFVLSRSTLVYFKDDPSALSQSGEKISTLGDIGLNNSTRVVVRKDKKLLTLLFPDGRAYKIRAETLEDLYEWNTVLEQVLGKASIAFVLRHNGIFRAHTSDSMDGSFHQRRVTRPVKSLVVGQPILLALKDRDGGPAFLEKALRFLETHGIKVEGILRQSADVEEVKRRVQDYEQGNNEFDANEDAHVIGDCVKHVLRELPSSPVPASCCSALLEAYKIDRKEARVNAMRLAILETFPEPNRKLLQRVLRMMHTVASHSSDNRMTPSAIAVSMAPLLLCPLVAGECELDDDFDTNGDNSAQLLASAQDIVTILLDDYENIFYVQRSPEHQQERGLRAALKIGLSMSSVQLSSPRGMDSKTRAELEEIALAEADVARSKQKVVESHLSLNQERLHQFDEACDSLWSPPPSEFYDDDSEIVNWFKFTAFNLDFFVPLAKRALEHFNSKTFKNWTFQKLIVAAQEETPRLVVHLNFEAKSEDGSRQFIFAELKSREDIDVYEVPNPSVYFDVYGCCSLSQDTEAGKKISRICQMCGYYVCHPGPAYGYCSAEGDIEAWRICC